MNIVDAVKSCMELINAGTSLTKDLPQKLLEVEQMAIELQEENANLRHELEIAQRVKNIEEDRIRGPEPYFTLRSEEKECVRYYCSTCWDKDKNLIQMWHDGENMLNCPACKVGFSMTPIKRIQRVGY